MKAPKTVELDGPHITIYQGCLKKKEAIIAINNPLSQVAQTQTSPEIHSFPPQTNPWILNHHLPKHPAPLA